MPTTMTNEQGMLYVKDLITMLFHCTYYGQEIWKATHWQGVGVLQNPMDMWMKQEILYETRPDYIIETGTALGGSAKFYTTVWPGKVITIDTRHELTPIGKQPKTTSAPFDAVGAGVLPRVEYVVGKSTEKKIVESVRKKVKGKRVMVILDSDHSKENVLAEMNAYGPMVTRGCYMIVEDTNIGGNPIQVSEYPGPGPMAAVMEYMAKHKDFAIDKSREKFLLTFYPNGWLKKL